MEGNGTRGRQHMRKGHNKQGCKMIEGVRDFHEQHDVLAELIRVLFVFMTWA